MATAAQANNQNLVQDYGDDDNSQGYDNDQQGDFDDQGGNENGDSNTSQNQSQKQSGGGGGPKYIRLRGLPWSATHQEILNFLKNVNVVNGSKGIHLVTSRWDGKNTGEAYVELQGQADLEEAEKLNKCSMGHRYIEVFVANPKEAKEAMRKTGSHGVSYVVKLRGLPYSVTEQQVEEFFNGLEIKPDREGILFVMDKRGRATGEAFVQFESEEDTEQALGRNREKIGHRYIEIFRSSLAELRRSTNGRNGRAGPYDLKDRGGNRANDYGGGMRGGDWGNNNAPFGVGANNTLGFNNLPNFTNSGNFGNNFGPNGNGGGFGGGGGGFGNNGNFGNDDDGFNNSGNFGNDFGDFGNFGNNRNFNNGGNFGNFGNDGNGPNNGGGNFGNFGNFGNNGGGGGNMGTGNGGNFGPIGGGRNDNEYFTIHMRGLPYQAFESEIYKFFHPIRPANVRVNFNNKGLHSGTADVYFDNYEDTQLAMKRHREQIGSRYIELFFDGKTKVGGNMGGGGGNFSRRI